MSTRQKTGYLVFLLMLTLAVFSCGSGEKVIPEMKAFMAEFDGTYQAVESALKKYAPGVDDQDMDLYDLKNPKIVSTEEQGDQVCYTLEAKAGITIRTYILCWKDGKILSIADKGMR